MSFQAMTWATSQTCGSAATKLVLLMLANHANGHTGQCNPRHKVLAEECEMRVETLKDHLKKLASLGLIEIVPQYAEGVQLPNHYTLLLQGGGGEKHPEGGGEKRTGGGGRFSPPRINQEVKNQEVEPIPPPPKGERKPGRFAEFWEAWPSHKRKVAKAQCEAKWRSKGCDAIADRVIEAVVSASKSQDWTKDGGEYIPSPLVWLNQARWEADTSETGNSPNQFAGVI